MTDESTIRRAEELSRRRARMLPFLAIIYFTQQATFFSGEAPGSRDVDHVKIGAWLVLSLVLLLALATNGFWFQKREVRELIDDESTKAHRAQAMTVGFMVAMLGAIVVYFVEQFEPVTSRVAIHIILSLGLGAALIRFGMLERRAHQDG